MFVTVRRYEGVTDPSEAGKRVREGFIPILSGIPGFVEYFWVDAGGGVMIAGEHGFVHWDPEQQPDKVLRGSRRIADGE